MNTPEIIAVTTAISTPLVVTFSKLFDFILARYKTKKIIEIDEMHQFNEDATAFRTELREEVKALRNRLDLVEAENFKLRSEIIDLKSENFKLRTEVYALQTTNTNLQCRIAELESVKTKQEFSDE